MNNVLVIGSGGREHALCWRLKQSPSVAKVFCAPGNGGIADDATCVAIKTPDEIVQFCKDEAIALVVIGPEQPLVEGLADTLEAADIPVFGPGARAARLEGSKGYMKELCRNHNIPTAAYGFFDNAAEAMAFLEQQSYPIVIKADGLAAGKGVIIAENEADAVAAIEDMFAGKIAGGSQVVIEEFMRGEEVSFFALCDGKKALPIGYAQDHKRAYDRDKGPNTGGMGAYAPPPVMNEALAKQVMERIVQPTLDGMAKEGAPFKGVLFAGLMLTPEGPKLLEHNVRFGDPETQVLMARFKGDLFVPLMACAKGNLNNETIEFCDEAGVCVVMATKGYPGSYKKGSLIGGLKEANAIEGVKVFHAGTEKRGSEIIATGGRVLGVTALGTTIKDAQEKAYRAVDCIEWPEGFCRTDIAWRALK
ncbi:MAG: phosphoribosylamine--glycine ligase [Rickettsiales bacterium]